MVQTPAHLIVPGMPGFFGVRKAMATGGGGGLWTPDQLGSSVLAIWLDASDASTFTFSSGSVVSQWNDKSGNGRHVSQSTVADQPSRVTGVLNSKAIVRFDGSNDSLLRIGMSGLTAALSLFCVSKLSSTTGTQGFVNLGNSSAGVRTALEFAANTMKALGALTNTSYSYTDATNFHLFGINNKQASGLDIWQDGTSEASTATNPGGTAPVTITLGALAGTTSPLNGDIAEIIVTVGALGTSDRQLVEGYQMWNWGLEGNLPSGHPYKSAAPTV